MNPKLAPLVWLFLLHCTAEVTPANLGGNSAGGANPVAGAAEGGSAPVGGEGGAATGGAAIGGAGGTGGSATGGEGGGGTPPDCTALVKPPAPFEQLQGFTSSEDFIFDEFGNYAGIDDNGNLVRINKAGEKSLWVAGISGGFMAGMVALPDGSVVICDVANNALKRAFPNGTVTTLLGGLQYPNGIDVGPDGYIYVAENGDDQVRRVHPDTGAFTIAAEGLVAPNGVAFSDDPHVFFVGSFGGGVVYKVELSDPTMPGIATEFATGFDSGGLDGLGVDECGYVYVAEYVTGNVYRSSPEGVVSLLVHVPSSWIPNIKWGRGLGASSAT